jgi:hypothetical protein
MLEIVLGIDNLVFIALLAGGLPPDSGHARAGSGWRSHWGLGLLYSGRSSGWSA